jgi:hypothetical protein
MASDIQLLYVVAFDASGAPVIHPLDEWKVVHNERQASIEVSYGSYRKTYDLRVKVIAIGLGEAKKKVALGKTLGRLALTGLIHGRHAASADLRWGGVDRDEYQNVFLVMDDLTTVQWEMHNPEFLELEKLLPKAAKVETAAGDVKKLRARINAMVEDGDRVLDELEASRLSLESQRDEVQAKVESAASFDERHAAREQSEALTQQLAELTTTQRAVLFQLAKKSKQDVTVSPAIAAPAIAAPSIATLVPQIAPSREQTPSALAAKAPEFRSESLAVEASAPPSLGRTAPMAEAASKPNPYLQPLPERASMTMGERLAKWAFVLIGGFGGLMLSIPFVLFLMPYGVLLMPVGFGVGCWMGPKMLAALMRRRTR